MILCEPTPSAPHSVKAARCGQSTLGADGSPPRYEIMEQLPYAYAYATLVEDCERVVDEVGCAKVRVRGLAAEVASVPT